jgi:hypothetical protein
MAGSKIWLLDAGEGGDVRAMVRCALLRSFTGAQVEVATAARVPREVEGLIIINGVDSELSLRKRGRGGMKLLVLGDVDQELAREIGLEVILDGAFSEKLIRSGRGGAYDSTGEYVEYVADQVLGRAAVFGRRYLCRYDFEREWNNHGYGEITSDGGMWSLRQRVKVKDAVTLAEVRNETGDCITAYCTVTDLPNASILWFNRAVGPVDSLEWRIVESFFSEYRCGELPCFPYLMEMPFGYDGAVTMHIDCDEAIASGRELFELYRRYGIPFGMAIKTGQEVSSDDIEMMREVLRSGGSAVSHSQNHLEKWGPDFETAYREALASRKWLEENVTGGRPVTRAVSPFYKNPPYAVAALAEAGYTGFVGGIISSDPEFLMGRAGIVPFVSKGIVSHSQQCMLHGDCYHRYGDSIEPYVEAFESHLKGEAIFGYLDHPFSERYWYGWKSEAERLGVHEQLIQHMKKSGNIWFCSLDECLGFIERRNQVGIWVDQHAELRTENPHSDSKLNFAVRWQDRVIQI